MARGSRRDKIAALFAAPEQGKTKDTTVTKKYRVGIYVRLSVENGGLGEDSESLNNQEQLLVDYVSGVPDLKLVKVYRDNGETGTDFNRPGFDMMMNDLRKELIDCIVVKDLSRFGRNYIETGEYIEKIFPFMGTRFISVLEHFDNTDPNANNKDLYVSLKNLMNEAYAKDKSMRICSAFEAKKRAGEFNVKSAPFGYKLSGDKKHPYLIDEPAASIVREIFELRRNGKSVRSIMQLMDEKYPTPRQYLYEKGVLHQCRENSHWDINAIIRTLNNRTYLGHMLSGKTVSRLYQGKKKAYISENHWDVVENVNEPIVSQEVFDAVQKLMQAEGDRRRSFLGKSKNPENIFKGLIFCRECGRFMHRGRTKITATNIAWYFGCSGYRNHKDRACSHRRTIREEKLKDAVLTFIKNQVKLADELMVRITNHNAGLLRNNLSDDKSLQTRQLRERLERLNLLLRTSFESYISGVISEEDYLFNKSKYEAEIKSCEEHMDLVAVKEKTIDVEGVRRNPYIVSLKKFSRARVLTREMCIALIDRIEIDEENAITIYPKYRDEFSALYEMIEEKERENE